jgi:hypothetical protein
LLAFGVHAQTPLGKVTGLATDPSGGSVPNASNAGGLAAGSWAAPSWRRERSFWVGNDVDDVVDVITDQEIETPILVDTGLPEIEALVILFGAERRVPKVPLQQSHLLVNGLP